MGDKSSFSRFSILIDVYPSRMEILIFWNFGIVFLDGSWSRVAVDNRFLITFRTQIANVNFRGGFKTNLQFDQEPLSHKPRTPK